MDSGARSTTRARKTLASSKIWEREWRSWGSGGAGGDLDEAELADDGLGAGDLVDVLGDLELVEGGADAVGDVGVGVGGFADDGHAGGVGALGFADGERDPNVDVEAAEEGGDAGEDAGLVLHVGYEGVEHACP